MIVLYAFFFFFSSRRRHTRCSRDWSSDVCSSDLLRNGHALTFEGKIDRDLLDDRVDVVAPGVVVHEAIDAQPLLLVQPPLQAPAPAGRLAVSRQQNAIVRPPELVFGETVPLGALLDQEDEIGCATPDL